MIKIKCKSYPLFLFLLFCAISLIIFLAIAVVYGIIWLAEYLHAAIGMPYFAFLGLLCFINGAIYLKKEK